ncbi:MAG: hypothetical protein KGQ75_09950 [Sphingomonadales bacterium]|nr:hypothetical protein [Sphingomonadales bacterium]
MRPSFTGAASLLAIAAMMATAPLPVRGQSFNATGTIVAGAGAILTAPGSTTIAADTPDLVINWVPDDTSIGGGPINFQTAGTTASFANRNATSLNVLNRILPTDPSRAIVFNGTVTSQLVDLASGAASRGGTLFFYSPGGLLVSSTGVFDVGNLVLTASDLNFDLQTGSFGTAGTYSFQPANAGSTVEVRNGARITAGPTSAYVALIAPRVINSGTIDVDGSAAIVAADAATITFRPSGLFDIQIDQGTSAAGEVVTSDGAITGAAGGANAAHRVYMVAVPRNDAITMAIKGGSSLGFDVAGAADVVGNAIVLSAGYNVTGGTIDAARAAQGGTGAAALTLGAITATSHVTGKASGQASLTVDSGNTARFASDLLLSGVRDPATASDEAAFISVGGIGSTLDIGNNLQLTALDVGQVTGAAATDSGNATIIVDQGTLMVGGAASISAARAPSAALDALGGKATLAARRGAVISIGSDLTLSASGMGKTATDASSAGPTAGFGGTAQLSFDGGSAVTVGRDLLLDATGLGGSTTLGGSFGANGTGGQAIVQGGLNGGSLSVAGGTTLDARGFGGQGLNCGTCTVEGGTATGGTAGVIAAKGSSFTIGSLLRLDASALGGSAGGSDGTDGGAAQGGTAFVRSDGGQITATQSLAVRAEGTGGAGSNVNTLVSGQPNSGGTGGNGAGGSATISAGDAASLGGGGLISTGGDAIVSTVGTGGSGGTGGAGIGGTSAVYARDGRVSGSALVVLADGVGGSGFNGGSGGSGQGARAELVSYSALEGGARLTFASASLAARGFGGLGSSPQFLSGLGSRGGDGTGGVVRALAEAGNGALALGETNLTADGIGGNGGDGFTFSVVTLGGENGGNGGTGRGGIAQAGVVSGLDTGAINNGAADIDVLSLSARGTGGNGGAPGAAGSATGNYGNGGAGYGGGAGLLARGGKVTLLSGAVIDAGGLGGGSGLGGTAGDGFVGDAGGLITPRGVQLEVGSRSGQPAQEGALVAADLTFLASAATGQGGTPGNATVVGHPLFWGLKGGTITAGNVSFLATGTPAANADPSLIALIGGSATLTGDLSFVTPGALRMTLDGANANTVHAAISAADWQEGILPSGITGTLFGSGSVTLTTGQDLFGHFSINTGGTLAIDAPGLVRLDNLTAAGDLGVTAGATVRLGALKAGGRTSIIAPGNLTLGTLDAGDSVLLHSDGTIVAAAMTAGLVSPSALSNATYNLTVLGLGGLSLGNVGAKGNVALLSPGAISSGSITGKEVAVLGTGNQLLGGITAAGRVLLADYAMASFGGDPLGAYDLAGVFAAAPVASAGVIALSGAANAGQFTALTSGSIALQDLGATAAAPADGTVRLKAGGALGTGALVATDRIDLQSGTTMTVASASAGAQLGISAGGALVAGNLGGVGGVDVLGGASVIAGAVSSTGSAGAVSLVSNGAMTIASVNATGAVVMNAVGGTLAGGDVSGDAVTAVGGDALALGAISALNGRVDVSAVNALRTGAISGATSVSLTSSAGGVTAGNLQSLASTVAVNAAAAASLGAVQAASGISLRSGAGLALASALSDSGNVVLAGGSGITSGNLTATGGELVLTAGGALGTGNPGDIAVSGNLTGAGVTLAANGTLSSGNITATVGSVSIDSAGAVTGGAISAAGAIQQANLGGAVSLGNLDAGGAILIDAAGSARVGDARAAGGTVELRANAGSLVAGNIAAATDMALVASTDISAGSVLARDMVLLAGGSVSAADLVSQTGRILAAGNALAAAGGGIGNFDFNAVFAAPMVAAGGNLALTGIVSGATFAAAFAGNVATRSVSAANGILVDAGGAARPGGLWQSPSIQLRASDLDLPAGSGLNAGLSGTITLVSRNTAGMRIGDGLGTGVVGANGFSIDNAEWSRINSGSLNVFAPDVSGAVDILIGKLDMTGPDAGSTIDDPLGAVVFGTFGSVAGPASGTIRITGAVKAVGFRASNSLVFRTGQFQLAADTGSLAVEGLGGTLSGTLRIDARDIHVAATSLLGPLAANPFFDGVEPALDRTSAGGNGPVLRAGALDLIVGRSLYIQRTGSGFDPLGFEEPLGGFNVQAAGSVPIAVIINGTFRTADGLVSGADAWRLFKSSRDTLAAFRPDSRLNGCLLTGLVCEIRLEPDPGIRTVFEWVNSPRLDDKPRDPENPAPLFRAAIAPPQLLLPIRPDRLEEQIAEPLAGSGNPALSGGSTVEGTQP